MDNRKRSILKAITWRLTGTLDTFLLSWIITGKPKVAASISVAELITKTLLYYLHERIWNKVKYGRKQDEDFVI